MNEDDSLLLVNGKDFQPTQTYNGEHRKHARFTLDNIQTTAMVDQSTSTTDLLENSRDQSTTTEDLSDADGAEEDARKSGIDSKNKEEKEKQNSKGIRDSRSRSRSLKESRELFKTKSSPNIMKGIKFVEWLYLWSFSKANENLLKLCSIRDFTKSF